MGCVGPQCPLGAENSSVCSGLGFRGMRVGNGSAGRVPDIRSTDIRHADFEARRVVRQPQVSLVAVQSQRSARMGSIACGVAVVVYVYGAFEDDYDVAGSV